MAERRLTCTLLDQVRLELAKDRKGMQEVASEHERVFRSVHGVYPPAGYEHRVPRQEIDVEAHVGNLVTEEGRVLLRGHDPLRELLQVRRSGRYQEEAFPTREDMIPHRCSTEVNVEVSIGPSHACKAILLYLGIVTPSTPGNRPGPLDPVNTPDQTRSKHLVVHGRS